MDITFSYWRLMVIYFLMVLLTFTLLASVFAIIISSNTLFFFLLIWHLDWKCVVINISNEHERKIDSTKTMLRSEAKENALSIEIVLRYISNNTLFLVGKVFIQFIMNVQKEKVQHIYFSLELNQVFNFRKKVFLMTSWIFDVEMFRNKLKV